MTSNLHLIVKRNKKFWQILFFGRSLPGTNPPWESYRLPHPPVYEATGEGIPVHHLRHQTGTFHHAFPLYCTFFVQIDQLHVQTTRLCIFMFVCPTLHVCPAPPSHPSHPQTVHAVAGLVPPSPPANMGPTGGSASAPQSLHSPHMRTEQLMSGNSAPNSPMAMLNIGSSHETEVGACEFDGRINVKPLIPSPVVSAVYKIQICQITVKHYDLITFLYKIMRIKYYPLSGIIATFYESIITI